HAELGYRFVKWALSASSSRELERAVQHEFAALAAEVPATRSLQHERDRDLLRHGIVPDTLRREIRGQAIAQVILPCSRALFRSEACPTHEATRSV
ncbi:MAG TPA: hypothetical protein VGC79_27580, partial [Polyangiaceae bacterium]